MIKKEVDFQNDKEKGIKPDFSKAA